MIGIQIVIYHINYRKTSTYLIVFLQVVQVLYQRGTSEERYPSRLHKEVPNAMLKGILLSLLLGFVACQKGVPPIRKCCQMNEVNNVNIQLPKSKQCSNQFFGKLFPILTIQNCTNLIRWLISRNDIPLAHCTA